MCETTIKDIIEILEVAPRIGKPTDSPEGQRYIQLTDTLAKKMVERLKQYQAEKRFSDGLENLQRMGCY